MKRGNYRVSKSGKGRQTFKVSHPVTLAIGYFRGKNLTPVITDTIHTTLTYETSSPNASDVTSEKAGEQTNTICTWFGTTAKKSRMNYEREQSGTHTVEFSWRK